MMIPTILYPVIAFGLAIGVGRIGTIVKDAMRVDFTTKWMIVMNLNQKRKGSVA
jgi:hypothetical protein